MCQQTHSDNNSTPLPEQRHNKKTVVSAAGICAPEQNTSSHEYYLRPTSLLTDEELEAKKWQDEYIQKHYGVSPITYEADDGRILVAFAFEVKSISKTALPIDTILERIDIDYNNGYIFEQSELCAGIGGSWENTYYATDAKIEPLDSTVYEFRGYADVPEEVMNNTDSSLNLNVYLNGRSHGRTTPDIVFNVR